MSGPAGRIVLVTGVSGVLGGRTARRLSTDPSVRRVIGVDVTPPRSDLGAVRFVRADIRNPVIAKVITQEDVDTVVHTSVVSTPALIGGRLSMKEHNIIGTMQLLAACQRAPGLERLVVKSSSEVYGSSNRDPAMFTEDMGPRRVARTGFVKDVLEIEGYVRGFSRRRPEVSVTVLRNAPLLSADVPSLLGDYFALNPIPKVLGFDARVQVLHHDDLVAALHHATLAGVPGTFNVASAGVLPMSQAVRRLGRLAVPVPGFALGTVGTAVRRARLGLGSFSSEQLGYLTYGRGIDTARMLNVLGFEPSRTTEEALAEFARVNPPTLLRTHPVVAVESTVAGLLGGTHA